MEERVGLDLLPQHQISNFSRQDRHNDVIRLVRDSSGIASARDRVLSFGCSRGIECRDIADAWPGCSVVGADISPGILDKARRRFSDPRLTFVLSTASNLSAAGPFDAIFALNVLCKHPETLGHENIAAVYPFAAFNDALELLDAILKPQGLLALVHTPYFFEDATIASRYLPVPSTDRIGTSEKCRPDGQRVTDIIVSMDGCETTRDAQAAAAAEGRFNIGDLPYRHRYRAGFESSHRLDTVIWRKIA
jgi:hypothetical protein